MDFEFESGVHNDDGQSVQTPQKNNDPVSIEGEEIQYDENGNPITPLQPGGEKEKEEEEKEKETTHDLEAGTELQVEDDVYTVDKDGNVVDKDGNIYKEAKDVKAWLDSFEQKEEDDETELNIKKIQEALDIVVTDENDNEIEYDNTPEGVKAYVEQVIENAREEHYETAINTLFSKYPFVEDLINYYNANGGSLEGYGQMPDRSGIELNESDEAQQEYIIRTAWKEQGRKGSVDGYIQYLKSTGNLFTTAQEELEALKDADAEYREQVRQQAEAAKQEQLEASRQYWSTVQQIVKSRQIAGYNIPESIVVTRNGQKTTATIDDFFNYIYQVDGQGKSRYNYDIEAEDPQARLHDDILRAYLKFTGGDFTNLLDMAINKKEVSKLILKSKENKKPSISVRKPTPKNNKKEINFGD